MSILVSIITVNYNGFNDTCELIDSIPINDDTLEVVVVDNASKNDEASLLSKRYPRIKTIRTKENLGFAGGNNIGIKEAKGKYIFLVNNDTIFKVFNLNPLIKRLESSEDIAVVCPKIRFSWDECPIQFAGFTQLSNITLRNHSIGYNEEDKGQYNQDHPTPYAHGAAMMIKKEVIEKIGLMPECYFLYYEELDWSMIIKRAGYKIWYEPGTTIFHKESKSTGQNSPLKAYYTTRNRLLFVKRNVISSIKYVSYAYLIGLVSVRDILRYLFKGQTKQAKATIKGIYNFIKM